MKIHFDTAPKTDLHWFEKPIKILKASDPVEVRFVLEELQRYLDEGYWIAGLASYELSYVLEKKITSLIPADRSIPLIQFGVFDGPCITNLSNSAYSISPFVSQWDEKKYNQTFDKVLSYICLLYTSPSPRDGTKSRMPSSA